MFQAFDFLIFLGSKKYLLPQFLTLLGSQVRMPFILTRVEDRNGIIIEDDFQDTKFLPLIYLFPFFEHTLYLSVPVIMFSLPLREKKLRA